jgi:hypothetical protein
MYQFRIVSPAVSGNFRPFFDGSHRPLCGSKKNDRSSRLWRSFRPDAYEHMAWINQIHQISCVTAIGLKGGEGPTGKGGQPWRR